MHRESYMPARIKRGSRARSIARAAGRAFEFSGFEALEERQLYVADPITASHPQWFANYTSNAVVVDGVMNDAEWAGAVPIVRTDANNANESVTMKMLYTPLGLYVGMDVKDQYLWADGTGKGGGSKWDWFNDDVMALFFDPSGTRKVYATPDLRALAFNLGAMNGPVTGTGVVTRYDYIKGTNVKGLGTDVVGSWVMPNGTLAPGISWKTVTHGTVNDNSDLDQGWTTELFLPWQAINMPDMPMSGRAITMNFSIMFDDQGGARDGSDKSTSTDPNVRFGPRVVDDTIDGAPSSYSTWAVGMNGPVDYAWLVFTDSRSSDKPTSVVPLWVDGIDGYGARLNFIAPVASSGVMSYGPAWRGGVYKYDIRWSETPITDELDWGSATPVVNTFTPHNKGTEQIRIGGLEPGNTYYVAIRGEDTAGRMGDIAQMTFTTQDELTDTSMGNRIMNSMSGSGLMTEAGQPFSMIASTITEDGLYVRNLYPGDGWNAANSSYINFSEAPAPEGDPSAYFDSLAASGVNTLRVSLEWLGTGAPGLNGTYWLESSPGVYNEDAHQYLLAVMAQANRVGIHLILSPFDTFDYKTHFNITPFAAQNGGPLTTIDTFFQNNTIQQMVQNRMMKVLDWVNASPDEPSVMGIELPNEWDDWGWTSNPQGDPGRLQEMRDRSKYILREAAAVKAYDPNMLIVSTTIGLVPRGPVARALFLADNLDLLTPHYYTATTSEPINSPDADKSIRPVTDYAGLASYWLTNRRDDRAVFNGEWGLVSWLWQGGKTYYTGLSPDAVPTKPWTLQNDIDMYRTTTWTQLAMGMAGGGNRLTGDEMIPLIPQNMQMITAPYPQGFRDIQYTAANFMADTSVGFNENGYNPLPLAGRVSFGNTGKSLIGVGSSDGDQGMVYVVQNLNKTFGQAPAATITIDGLNNGDLMNVEFWTTGTGGAQISEVFGAAVLNHKLTVTLPAFSKDIMVRFAAA
jgi:hypothetical protein